MAKGRRGLGDVPSGQAARALLVAVVLAAVVTGGRLLLGPHLGLGGLVVECLAIMAIMAIIGVMHRARVQKDLAVDQAHRLQVLTAGLAAARSAQEVASVVVDQAVALLGPATGALALPRPDGKLELVGHHGQSEATMRAFGVFSPEDPLPAARAFRSGEIEWIDDADTFAARYPGIAGSELHGKAGMVSLPLISNGRIIGATTYRFDQPRRFTAADKELLRSFVALAAQALDRTLTAGRAAAFRGRLEALNDLGAALGAALTREEVAAVVVRQGMAAMTADTCTLYVVDDRDGSLELIGEAGVAPEISRRIKRIPRDSDNPVVATLTSTRSLWAENEQQYHALFPALAALKTDQPRAHAFWSFPLLVEGRAIGLLGMGFYQDRHFPEEDRRFVQTFTSQCAQAVRRVQRVEAERAARQAAERAQALLSTTLCSIGDAVITTDTHGHVTFMNPVAEKLTGWRQDDARGKPLRVVFRIVNENTRNEVESPVERVLREGVVVGLANHTVLLGLGNGQETPIDDSGAPIRDADGHIQGVVLVFRDVSAKKADEARRGFIADVVGMLGASLDDEAALAQLAQAVVPRLADWCSVDIVDGSTGELRQVPVAHEPRDFPAAIRKVVRTGKSEFYPEISEDLIRAQARDATQAATLLDLPLRSMMIVPLVARGRTMGGMTFVSAESGRRYHADDLAFVEDLARRAAIALDNAQLYSAEQRARRAADAANRSKDEFLATVSHELRTPLTAILGWSRLLARGGMDQARQAKAVQTIERNALAMVQLIEDLLDISRIISGRLRLDVQPVEFPSVIQAAVDSIKPAIDAKNLSLRVAAPPPEALVVGDPTRLQQVMWNLLSNAAKFTPKGGQIQVDLRRQQSSLVVTVSDTGKGIDAIFLPHVFDRFRQADSSIRRSHGGLGLGLAITRQLVELHGGSIAVHSDGEGRGARFDVTLPISVVQLDDEVAPRQAREREILRASFDVPSQLRGLKVLVVDDEPDARQLVRAILESCQSQVREAGSVAEGLSAFTNETPDVLISDIGMPVEDGFALISKIRALPPASGGAVPVAALTAFARAEDRLAVLNAGFTTHIPKPVDPAELVAVVASLARGRQPARN